MSEWVLDELGCLVSFQKGKKVDTSKYNMPSYRRYLGAGSLAGKHDGYASTNFSVQTNKNDVLMLWDGERSGLVAHRLSGVVSSTVSKLTPNKSIRGDYLYYFLLLNFEWIQNRRTGTGVPHVPKDLNRMLVVKYPKDKLHQIKIAKILSTIDQTIEKTEALIEKYQQIKAGLMYDLFTRGITADGKLRPPREQAPELYQETPIGWIPKGWTIDTLKNIFGAGNIVNGPFGSDLLTSELKDEGVPVLYCQDIKPNLFSRVSISHVTLAKATELSFCNVRKNDILLAKVGAPPCDSCVYIDDKKAIVTQDVIRIRPNQYIDSEYFSSLFNSNFGRSAIKKISIEGTRERVSLGDFKAILVPLAKPDEQYRIGFRLVNAQKLISCEVDELTKLCRQKLGLMQDLLTGKVPVTVDKTETNHAS